MRGGRGPGPETVDIDPITDRSTYPLQTNGLLDAFHHLQTHNDLHASALNDLATKIGVFAKEAEDAVVSAVKVLKKTTVQVPVP